MIEIDNDFARIWCGTPVGNSVQNWWYAQSAGVLNSAAAKIESCEANPWVFSADARHFEQFAESNDMDAYNALTEAEKSALIGHWG